MGAGEGARTAAAATASAAGHLLLLSLALMVAPRDLPVRHVEAISVEIIPLWRFDALLEDGPTPAPAPPAVLDPPPAASGGFVAHEFYSAAVLAEPGMARVRKALATLADTERLVQLCSVEAIEQIGRHAAGFDPDSVVSYAMSDPKLAGLTLVAPGGAFRSRRAWFELSFSCTVARDYAGVTAFAFRIGDPIPPDQWDAHNLIAEDDGG